MEVAQLLHKMALADGIPTSQVRGHTAVLRCAVLCRVHCVLCVLVLLLLLSMWCLALLLGITGTSHASAWLRPLPLPTCLPPPRPPDFSMLSLHPLLQLHLPGMSTSASFDDLLHQLMMAESTLSTSL